jgi:penicillin-binding protein 1A
MLIEREDVAEPADEPDFIEEDGELVEQPPARRGRLARRIALGAGLILLLLIAVLALTAPLSKSLQPITAPSVTLLSAEGKPIARRGAVIDAPVEAEKLPRHIPQAFLAIEDRRFYEHLGVDPWSIARAGVRNLRAGGVVEGGSTISQQMAKLSFLSSDQTAARKIQEAILALWLDAWLDKDQILSRYLSSVYFGDNVYGIRAAANHYFSRTPEQLTVEQAAMLAGLVKAPSTLAPTKNLKGARERGKVVVQAMVTAGFLDPASAEKLPEVTLKRGPAKDVPAGTYFADWVFSELGESEPRYGEQRIQTTLEDRLQRLAAQSIRSVGTSGAQVAMVSMRPDGRVVAMVGGRSYKESPFNRVTQAKRQSGSTFKLFVYLAALRAGYTPSDAIEDRPLTIGKWSPENYESKYQGVISLRDAFAASSNVAAVRLSEAVGRERVIQAARDLGVASELEQGPTVALGTSAMSLMELTGAFASVAKGDYPVKPRGLPESEEAFVGTPFEGSTRRHMLELLAAVTRQGTGRGAALEVPTFGKTGTSQSSRDAYFVGFAGDLVTGVWIGHDDNRPLGNVTGGSTPALIWRAFMADAVKDVPVAETAESEPVAEELPPLPDGSVPVPDYDVQDYDVESAPPPAEGGAIEGDPAPANELPASAEPPELDAASPPPVLVPSRPQDAAPPAAGTPRPGENAPAPRRREIPTVTPPPPPPAPKDEPPPEDSASPESSDG